MKKASRNILCLATATGLFTLLVYLPTLSCGFINLDDPFYITNNPLIKSLSLESLRRIFTEAHLSAWLPLTYLSLAVDFHFWGDNPAGYHLTNILLHAANAAMVVLLADRLLTQGPVSLDKPGENPGGYLCTAAVLLAGLLWGVHPLRVESVAWAAERKDVLNGFFTLAAVLAYLDYAWRKDRGEAHSHLPSYLLSLAFFTLSLLAKQVSVTLPVILLLLDWCPLGRLTRVRLRALLVEKLPFLAISLLITFVTIYFAATENKMISMQDMPLSVRFFASGNAIFEYCRMSLFPVGISPYIVLSKPMPYRYLVNTAAVAAFTLYLLRSAHRQPKVAATWFAFVILLSPMLSFVQAGDDIALAARYTYLPLIPVSIAVAVVLAKFTGELSTHGRRDFALAMLGITGVFLVGSVIITMRLINVWKDTSSFWTRVIEIEPVGRAYGDRGVYYLINRKSAAALDDFTVAIGIAENAGVKSMYNLYAFRGVALSDIGRYAEAVADFDRAISMNPHPTYFQLRGAALKALGRVAEADSDFRRAGSNPPPIDWF